MLNKAKRTDHSTLLITQYFLTFLTKPELHTQMQPSMKPLYLTISGIKNKEKYRLTYDTTHPLKRHRNSDKTEKTM